MKGNCLDCPMNMDPPKIMVIISNLGEGTAVGYYCKLECAQENTNRVLTDSAAQGKITVTEEPKEVYFSEDIPTPPAQVAVDTAAEALLQTLQEKPKGPNKLDTISPYTILGGLELRFATDQFQVYTKDITYIPGASMIVRREQKTAAFFVDDHTIRVRFGSNVGIDENLDIYSLSFDASEFGAQMNRDYDNLRDHVELVFAEMDPEQVTLLANTNGVYMKETGEPIAFAGGNTITVQTLPDTVTFTGDTHDVTNNFDMEALAVNLATQEPINDEGYWAQIANDEPAQNDEFFLADLTADLLEPDAIDDF